MNTEAKLTKHQILLMLRENPALLRKCKVKRIGLFGSFATGKQTKKSDIDFVVEFSEPTFDNFMALHHSLEKLLGRNIEILTPEGVRSIRVKSVSESILKSLVYV